MRWCGRPVTHDELDLPWRDTAGGAIECLAECHRGCIAQYSIGTATYLAPRIGAQGLTDWDRIRASVHSLLPRFEPGLSPELDESLRGLVAQATSISSVVRFDRESYLNARVIANMLFEAYTALLNVGSPVDLTQSPTIAHRWRVEAAASRALDAWLVRQPFAR